MPLYVEPKTESVVNTFTNLGQYEPDVAALTDGSYVVVWRTDDPSKDGSGNSDGIRAQRFDAAGAKLGAEFNIQTVSSGDQRLPKIVALDGGKYAVTWQTAGSHDTDGLAIKVKIFNTDGSTYSAEQVVNTQFTDDQTQPDIAKLNDGGFVVVWTTDDTTQDSSNYAIKSQRFDASGVKTGAEMLVNTTTLGFQQEPVVTGLADGKYVVAWKSDTAVQDIKVQIFNADGSIFGTEFFANQTIAGQQYDPALAALANGNFIVTFTGADSNGSGVFGRIFKPDGTALGDEFLVNQQTSGPQYDGRVEAVGKNWFVVTWTSYDGGSADTKARLFNNNGTPAGDEFIVHNANATEDYMPAVAFLPDGRLIVVWEDNSVIDIKSNIIDITNLQIGDDDNNNLNGTGKDDYLYGEGGADTVKGSKGDDIMRGGDGTDTMKGGGGADRMYGDGSKDDMKGDNGKDTMYGGGGNDTMKGGNSNDTMFGEKGKDKLFGDKGNDKLDGGKGNDTFTGGKGSDTFVFVKDGSSTKGKGKKIKYKGADKVNDYKDGLDKFDLQDFNFKNKKKALKYFKEVGTTSDDQVEFAYKGEKVLIKGADLGDIGGSDLLI